ncbi:hypothetical protein SAMN05444678_1145 [Sphingomonas sp. YR710]|uniref:hypothetical protein n=1 Tax=Sphingomonas sp. YR710 TaxID=1882773 RepID=UPI0008879DA1|nr:hypothetical protein [Sphingomonas sp. YR710]SDD47973.1 hypothetical protein SAMN05444678_1145 [Sphingomonas sp. YR710]
MSALQDIPKNVTDLMRSVLHMQFATVSGEGVPIDTPIMTFSSDDLGIISGATGLAYPVKAERARRNPKVGLLIEGTVDEPVISVAGLCAVRDADIQANLIRYLSETGHYSVGTSRPWELTRNAVWYWARIIMDVTPKRIMWWENRAAMDQPPNVWTAPADTVFPPSDPAPAGRPSGASKWPQRDWREFARPFVEGGVPGHLTLLDPEGFPLPIGVRGVRMTDTMFELDVPLGVPWTGAGMATFTFAGCATFVGPVSGSGGSMQLMVERMLPVHPMVEDPAQVLEPSDEVRAALLSRLGEELARRGQPIPIVPEERPAPSAGALRRRDRDARVRQA